MNGSFVVEVDMTRQASITAMVNATIRHYGRIDVLANNAGRALCASVADIKTPDFQGIMEPNVYGPILDIRLS